MSYVNTDDYRLVDVDRRKWMRTDYLLQRIEQWGELVPEPDYSSWPYSREPSDRREPKWLVSCRAANGDTETFSFHSLYEAMRMVECMQNNGLGVRTGCYRKVSEVW
jgi:hypothetical protein